MVTIVKRNGNKEDFDQGKIFLAISKANAEVLYHNPEMAISDKKIRSIARNVEKSCDPTIGEIPVEDIQEMVETELMKAKAYEVAKQYIRYRKKHAMARDKYNELMDALRDKIEAADVQNQNANVDEQSFGGRAGEAKNLIMKHFALDYCMSDMSKRNHLNNEIYIHDLDSYAVGMHNCLSVPFDKLLASGFNTRQTDVRPANSLSTAMQLVAVIFQLQSLQQFGGVSATHLDWTMVPYVRKSFAKYYKDGLKYLNTYISPTSGYDYSEVGFNKATQIDGGLSIEDRCYTTNGEVWQYAMDLVQREIYQAVEGLYHNLNTLQSRSGNQLN